ncbi:hypothetical protein QWY16_07030 [Planococcus shenhongbingii]|uniref:Uncharacterized protein n=1 Tax=Planococcus shenhongbingii TaxID=3058398 RepID=A0ABT8NDN6_9BACL|nr:MULTISPECIES: hypothetical protein [unclassified Planococcus (in: firmicutes)]MDN7246014.1 hypothetical protein [Planococcus sp. N017]WKA59856.1 hypothetical protein QWY16_07030 [Planococcus sp. N016]
MEYPLNGRECKAIQQSQRKAKAAGANWLLFSIVYFRIRRAYNSSIISRNKIKGRMVRKARWQQKKKAYYIRF